MQTHIWKDWLMKRGITEAVIDDFELSWGSHPTMGDCIYIPVRGSNGAFSFNKYRRDPAQGDVKPKYVYDKGGRAELYGADRIGGEGKVLVVEGELDALVAWSSNIAAVSSTGGAGTFKEEWVGLLDGKDVTICYDNDGAGGSGMVRVLSLLEGAYVLFLPDRPGVKDITDYVAGGGDLQELLRSRVRFNGLQDVIDDRARRLSLWQSVHFHDAYIEAHTNREYASGGSRVVVDGDRVARAKAHPISDLIKVGKDGKAFCIWHKEKTPSLHYYKKTNTVYCWGGCGKHGDAIDVYRAVHGCSFGEALDRLV